MKNLFIVLLFSAAFFSCSKDSSGPVNPEPSNTIYTYSGVLDTLRMNTPGISSLTKSFFSSVYDFTSLDSITVVYTYTKSGSSSTPLSIVYIESSQPYSLYDQPDTLKAMHSNTFSKRIPSPKKSVTLGYVIRAEKLVSDTTYAFVKLSDVSIYRKNP